LGELTRKNLPSVSQGKAIKRQIAISAHDYLVVAPTIDGEVNTSAVISGNFLASEIEYILGQVRSGAAVDWTARRK
jgi:preprotein translocase subunit SecD